MVRRRPELRGFGPAAVPWTCPLALLINKKHTPGWTSRHQAMLRTIAAGGLWPAARLHAAGILPSNQCAVCGDAGTVHHRGWCCAGREAFWSDCELPDGVLELAASQPTFPLWTQALVNDPTRPFPQPITIEPEWTVIPSGNRKRFRGSAFGDGSAVAPFGPKSCQAGYAVVQIVYAHDSYVLSACLLGPLRGPLQSVPAAELYSLLIYLQNLDDEHDAIFYSDCTLVVASYLLGEAGTTGAAHVHANLWSRVWMLHRRRRNPVRVEKVKAHVSRRTSDDTPDFLADTNSFAEVGAKEGRFKHPSNDVAEKDAMRTFELVTFTAIFLHVLWWRLPRPLTMYQNMTYKRKEHLATGANVALHLAMFSCQMVPR